jgi:hypothetical protein
VSSVVQKKLKSFFKMFAKLSRWLNRKTDTAPLERSLLAKARELLAKAEVPAALQMLMDAGCAEATALNLKRKEALDQYERKLIDAETFQITNNRIIYALLKMVESAKAASTNTPEISKVEDVGESLPAHFTEDQCRQIRTRLLQNEYLAAFELAKNWSQDGLLLFLRYEQATRDLYLGLVRQEDYQLVLQKIIYAATALVSPEEARSPLTVEQQSQLRQLMEESQWSALLTLGGEWNEDFLLLSTGYYQVETSFSKGLITKLSYEDAINKIQQGVKKLLEEN